MTAISAYSANLMPVGTAPSALAAPAVQSPHVELQPTGSPASRSQTGFDAAPVSATPSSSAPAPNQAAGGGEISDALKSGVAKITAWAHKGMTSIQEAIQGDMASNNGQVDPAKMQQYTMQMSSYEMLMRMAAKIQEKEDAAISVWLR